MRVEKWSTKPADHNVTRVRNNQRRHRARVKSHIQDLEKRLDETNSRLELALSTVASLTAELQVLRRGTSVTSGLTNLTTPVPADDNPANILDQTAALPQASNTGDVTDCDCTGLPAPAPGESTVPCSYAFQIIEQQNYSGVEVTTIRAWLTPGFRKAFKPDESCRVESNRLYELLDHITSTT